ncbi:MAG: primosomal protein N' [Victivallaceae bacterium]|nr:primosomal protein N' [Victivallaceae bacterium]
MIVAKVLLDLSLDRGFDYIIPEKLKKTVGVGSQVMAPFGHSVRKGFVVAVAGSTDYRDELKEIIGPAPGGARIPEKLLELGEWMAQYYCASGEQAVRSLLPGAVRHGRVKEKTLKLYSLAESLPETTVSGAKQKIVLDVLRKEGELPLAAVKSLAGCSDQVVRNLVSLGYVSARETVCARKLFYDEVAATSPLVPTPEQEKALETCAALPSGGVMLLYGVTNSGKTEVYLQAIAGTLAAGRSAIVLVPEISLTPQTVRRFRSRFGDNVAVMHSRLTEAEKFEQWNRIRKKEVSIAVGARSALFAPFENLGLIVVDEEHESSYKQNESPRYHARDVAVMRGKLENAKVILGSATPSFESYTNALNGKYALAHLTATAAGALKPDIVTVDLRMETGEIEEGERKSVLFSPMLVNAIRDRLSRAEQTILFFNRRGYARQMMCEDCGYVPGCPECSVAGDRPAAFTYHKREGLLTCHMCGFTMPAPNVCPECGSPSVHFSGSGTEKLEAMARKVFPNARIARMDADTTRGSDGHERILDRLQRNEIDILIGTQMIAKGLHFPNITLVGVVNADQSLYLPDFRSAERTFGLISQVAGRAGRGDAPGEVIVQTFSPLNETIQLAARGGYEEFYRYDMNVRELLKYPPAARLILIHFRSEDREICRQCAEEFYVGLVPFIGADVQAVAPMPAPVERIKGKFRYQIMLRGTKMAGLRRKVRELAMKKYKNAEVIVDVDPQSLE